MCRLHSYVIKINTGVHVLTYLMWVIFFFFNVDRSLSFSLLELCRSVDNFKVIYGSLQNAVLTFAFYRFVLLLEGLPRWLTW